MIKHKETIDECNWLYWNLEMHNVTFLFSWLRKQLPFPLSLKMWVLTPHASLTFRTRRSFWRRWTTVSFEKNTDMFSIFILFFCGQRGLDTGKLRGNLPPIFETFSVGPQKVPSPLQPERSNVGHWSSSMRYCSLGRRGGWASPMGEGNGSSCVNSRGLDEFIYTEI